MQDTDREDFEQQLRELFAAMDRPLSDGQVEACWKGLRKLSLMEFGRIRDSLFAEWEREAPPKRFGVPEIWAAKRRLRAAGPPATSMPTQPAWDGDRWAEFANQRLLKHVTTMVPADPRRYGTPASAQAMKASREPNADASPEFMASVGVLIAYKNRWAQTMRAAALDSFVSEAEQDESWRECMRSAEAEIEQRMQRLAQSEAA